MYRTIDDPERGGTASAAFGVEHLDRRLGRVEGGIDLGAREPGVGQRVDHRRDADRLAEERLELGIVVGGHHDAHRVDVEHDGRVDIAVAHCRRRRIAIVELDQVDLDLDSGRDLLATCRRTRPTARRRHRSCGNRSHRRGSRGARRRRSNRAPGSPATIQIALRRNDSRSSRAITSRVASTRLIGRPPARPGSSSGRRVGAAARNSSDNDGASTPKSLHRRVGPDEVEDRAGVGEVSELDPCAVRVDPFDHGRRLTEPCRLDGDVDAEVAIGALALQRAHVAMEHHHSPIDQRDRLAEILDEVELMAREQHVASIGHVVEHDLRQELHGAGIEPGERLVEHDQVGSVHHRRRELHPLGHPARQVADRVAGAVLETEPGEQVERPLAAPPACRARAGERSTRGGRRRACRGTALAPGACSPTNAGRRRSPADPSTRSCRRRDRARRR